MASIVQGLGGPAGLGETVLPRSDDAAFRHDISAVFDQGLTLFGQALDPSGFHIGTNGILSFGQGVTGFPPDLTLADAAQGGAVIAPFFADADLRLNGEGVESGQIHLDIDPVADIVTVTWDAIGRFRRDTTAPNSFQVQLIDRQNGDVDIVFRYRSIGWTAGDLSIGAPALAGIAAAGSLVALPASGDTAALMALPDAPGTGGVGIWRFEFRDGALTPSADLVLRTEGGTGADLLTGTAGDDFLIGLGGDDTLISGGGNDTLDGGPGTDRAVIGAPLAGARFFRDGAVLHVTLPGSGAVIDLVEIEVVDFDDATVNAADVPLSGGPGPELIVGGPGQDTLFGGPGDDTLAGGGGADLLDGGAGIDRARFDVPLAAAGMDWQDGVLRITIGGQVTRLTGVEWLEFADFDLPVLAQTLTGGDAADALNGGAGADTISGGGGDDTVTGGAGDDLLRGGSGDDWLLGGNGDDTLDGGTGNNRLDGGDGTDTARFGFEWALATLAVIPGGVELRRAGSLEVTTLIDIEILSFADRAIAVESALSDPPGQILTGGPGPDTLTGGPGADTIFGAGGDDSLTGGSGADSIHAGDGADTVIGGDGDDLIFGGASAADLRDNIFGGAGNDTIDGGHGNDELRGDADNDVLRGGFGVDSLFGGAGNDTINGGAFSDLVFGGDGADFVNGGFGFDRINGGDGADTFFHLGIADHGSDWIQDFAHAEGDVLRFGQAGATGSDFQVNIATTQGAGDAGVDEAFVIYKPTGQIVWALVDGAANPSLNLSVTGSDAVFDLLA